MLRFRFIMRRGYEAEPAKGKGEGQGLASGASTRSPRAHTEHTRRLQASRHCCLLGTQCPGVLLGGWPHRHPLISRYPVLTPRKQMLSINPIVCTEARHREPCIPCCGNGGNSPQTHVPKSQVQAGLFQATSVQFAHECPIFSTL